MQTQAIPPDVKTVIFAYLPYFISLAVGIVVCTAGIMTWAFSVLDKRTKIFIDIIDRQLNETKEKLRECQAQLINQQNKPQFTPGMEQIPPPPKRHGLRVLFITATVGVLFVLATIPFSQRFRLLVHDYSRQAQQIRECAGQLAQMTQPFEASQVLALKNGVPEGKVSTVKIDGHVVDLDAVKERKFQYTGSQPAIFVASSVRNLSINHNSKSKISLLVMPYDSKR
jgi:hypothetical protein